jgi:hypothetical protein
MIPAEHLALGSHAIADPIHMKALLRQSGLEARAQQFVVFGQQDAHDSRPVQS